MPKYAFEARIPLDLGMEVVAIVRAGELSTRRSEVVQLAGAITGEIGAFLGQFDGPTPVGDVDTPCTLEALCDAVEQLDPAEGAATFNPIVWATLLQLALKVLQELL